MIDVVFVVLPDTLLLDLAGPAEAFRIANQQLLSRGREVAFRLRHVGPQAAASTSVGATLSGLEDLPMAFDNETWIVLLGQPTGCESPLRRPLPRAWTETRQWLAHAVAPKLAAPGPLPVGLLTVCAGALLAADAGLLAGRECTTHHEKLAELQTLAPTAIVQANRVFVIDGPVASSAGVTAGIDLALHLIGQRCGHAIVAAVAQVMVVFARRGARDPERSPLLARRDHLHPAVHRLQDAIAERPEANWSLISMAQIAHVTPRHLSRLFREHVGQSPRDYVEGIRVALVEQALREGASAHGAIEMTGLSGARQWRRIRARHQAHAAAALAG